MPVEPDAAPPRTVLAFDYGLRRIGVAVGQSVTGSAGPLGVVSNGESGVDRSRVDALIREWRPDVLVVGLPQRADGTDSEVTAAVRAFAASLSDYGKPVQFIDERHTSTEAEAGLKRLRAAGARGRIEKADIDAAAAVAIAERFLAGANRLP